MHLVGTVTQQSYLLYTLLAAHPCTYIYLYIVIMLQRRVSLLIRTIYSHVSPCMNKHVTIAYLRFLFEVQKVFDTSTLRSLFQVKPEYWIKGILFAEYAKVNIYHFTSRHDMWVPCPCMLGLQVCDNQPGMQSHDDQDFLPDWQPKIYIFYHCGFSVAAPAIGSWKYSSKSRRLCRAWSSRLPIYPTSYRHPASRVLAAG